MYISYPPKLWNTTVLFVFFIIKEVNYVENILLIIILREVEHTRILHTLHNSKVSGQTLLENVSLVTNLWLILKYFLYFWYSISVQTDKNTVCGKEK